MERLLTINNLTVSFENPQGRLTAVKNVSVTLERGETLALVGESGCGKTVLCKSMLKVLCSRGRIDEGEILFRQEELTSLTEREMTPYRGGKIAMVFQDPMTSLDPAFSVGEQIAEVIRRHEGCSHSKAREDAIELMRLVSIPDAKIRYNQRPYQFSGGMRQRIAIAMALAGKPDILLADEPTTALDQNTREEIMVLLKKIQQETEAAVLFITHDLSLVEGIADRVAIMQAGRIVEEGLVEKVFAHPEHPYTRKLLGYLDYNKNRGHNHRVAVQAQPIISVRNLNKSFAIDRLHENRVLEDISIEIYKGEIVGLVGRSGCGKSTLARCIAGIENADSGVIDKAEDIAVRMIFQDSQSAFNDRMTVRQIIEEPLRIGRSRRDSWSFSGRRQYKGRVCEAVKEAMEAVELAPELADRRPYELSGGQRQRAAIARALITQPDFIIADEPLTGLDVSAQAQIAHLFRRLSDEKGLTILFIAHDLPMVNHISGRIIELS